MSDSIHKGNIEVSLGARGMAEAKTQGYTRPAAPNFFFMTYSQLSKYWAKFKNEDYEKQETIS